MSEINVLYCFDTNFWKLAAVSISSLMQTQRPDTHVTLHCMVAPHTRGRRTIKKIVTTHGGHLVWHVVKRRESPYRTYDYSRWSPVIFYRLFAHRAFPNLDKILYIDSDTLVRDDLSTLYNTNISKYAMGAVRDMAPVEIPNDPNGIYVREFQEKYLKNKLYVNSGVLLLNLPKMHENETNLLKVKIPLTYPDQDILNVGLDGKILELPLKYNFVPEAIKQNLNKTEYEEAEKHPVIWHFYAAKPYMYEYAKPDSYSTFYKTATPLGFYPEDFIKNDIKRIQKRRHKTNIPYLRIDKRGHLRLFGVLRI